MQIWITHPEVKTPPPMPDAATADITLRRLQQFKMEAGKSYAWQLVREGKEIASGSVNADANKLFTISKVPLTTEPADLTLRPATP